MKQLFNITVGETKETVQPVLSIRLGEKHCSFSITDFITKDLKSLAYYSVDEVTDSFLREILSVHPELNNTFYQVLVSYDYPHSSLVSFSNYKHEEAGFLLNTLFGLNDGSTVVSESVADWQLYNVYAVPKGVQQWINNKFSAAKYWHQYTVNIKNIKPAMEGGSILLDVRQDDFTVLVSANNKLLLAQTFCYSTPEDVIYYLLKICEQFDLSQQDVQIGLSGLIDQQSALYRELYQYFLQVEFRNPSWIIPATANSESPLHFFTSLNDLSQCAS